MLSRLSVTAAKQAGRTFSTTSQVIAITRLSQRQIFFIWLANFLIILQYTRSAFT